MTPKCPVCGKPLRPYMLTDKRTLWDCTCGYDSRLETDNEEKESEDLLRDMRVE